MSAPASEEPYPENLNIEEFPPPARPNGPDREPPPSFAYPRGGARSRSAQGQRDLAMTLQAPAQTHTAAPAHEPPLRPLDLPSIAYRVTLAKAEATVREILRDAAGRPVALDIETAPKPSEVIRLRKLEERLAGLKGELRAARKAKTPAEEIAALMASGKLVKARIKYIGKAALDPHRGRVRSAQLYAGGERVAVIDIFRTGEAALSFLDGVDIVCHNAGFEVSSSRACRSRARRDSRHRSGRPIDLKRMVHGPR